MFTEGERRGRVELLRHRDLHGEDEGRPRPVGLSLGDRLGLELCLHVHPDTGLAALWVGGILGLEIELGSRVAETKSPDKLLAWPGGESLPGVRSADVEVRGEVVEPGRSAVELLSEGGAELNINSEELPGINYQTFLAQLAVIFFPSQAGLARFLP